MIVENFTNEETCEGAIGVSFIHEHTLQGGSKVNVVVSVLVEDYNSADKAEIRSLCAKKTRSKMLYFKLAEELNKIV